jgi:hypothetical protein
MKRHLLFCAGMILGICVNAQQNGRMQPAVNLAERLAVKYSFGNSPVELDSKSSTIFTEPQQPLSTLKSSSAAIQWNAISGSMNIFGVLYSNQRALQYNDELKTVTFVHRKSNTYSPSPFPSPDPGATSGAIVTQVSTNWGATWDSTCIWNNNANWARYPQGGVYNPPGNTNPTNAYIVGTGPVTDGANWVGNFFASKKLDVFDNVASAVPNAQQYISNTAPSSVGKVDYAYLDFTATDDGVVRALGTILSGQGSGTFEGARIIKGSFNSGVFNWTGDSIGPAANTNANGAWEAYSRPGMAWNETGDVGYVWFIGSKQGATGNNRGYQPIVYKTTNSGNSWSLMSSIDFNNNQFNSVLNRLYPTADDPGSTIPFFWWPEGIDGTVDKNNRLHLVSTLVSTQTSSNVLSAYGFSSSIDGETGYAFDHDSLAKPLIYDFTETALGWDVLLIDSIATEGPGTASNQSGYQLNPWDGDASSGDKVECDSRIQLSRTPDGQYIVYTWAESDPLFTSGGKRWNQLPNIKARVRNVNNQSVEPTQQNLTGLSGTNPMVKNRAHMLQISPKCDFIKPDANNSILTVPMKVSNNQNTPLKQLEPNVHWYASASVFTISTIGVRENASLSAESTLLFPNPASMSTNLVVNLKNSSSVEITLLNNLGQSIKTITRKGSVGDNLFALELSGLSSGIYLVSVRAAESQLVKKLVIE